jgi:hypothetical protein
MAKIIAAVMAATTLTLVLAGPARAWAGAEEAYLHSLREDGLLGPGGMVAERAAIQSGYEICKVLSAGYSKHDAILGIVNAYRVGYSEAKHLVMNTELWLCED